MNNYSTKKAMLTMWDAVREREKELYGDNPPSEIVSKMIAEWRLIMENGYMMLFDVVRRLIQDSTEKGYPVEIESAIGSSLIAYLAGITKANPLPVHYRCPCCKEVQFFHNAPFLSSFLTDKKCSKCNADLDKCGYNLATEFLWGIYGDREPYVCIGIVDEYINHAHRLLADLFGKEHVFLEEPCVSMADGHVACVCIPSESEGTNASASRGFSAACPPIKVDLVPLKSLKVLRNIQLSSISSIPTIRFDGDVPIDCAFWATSFRRESCANLFNEIFSSVSFLDLSKMILIESLAVSTGLWKDNQNRLLTSGIIGYYDIISSREDVFQYLVERQFTRERAFKISEAVRKGRFACLSDHDFWVEEMKDRGVPEWFVGVLNKTEYIYTRAAAVQIAMTDYKLAWIKAHSPQIKN